MGREKMTRISLAHLIFGPRSVNEIAWPRTEIAAVIVNAVSGMVLTAVIAMFLRSFLTLTLAVLLIILFGPLIGFFYCSLYSRLEWFVGTRLGGKASLDDLYRIFAWAFLPLSLAFLLYSILCMFADTLKVPPETVTVIAESIPSLVLGYCSLRSYCSNVIAAQQFTRIRGAVSIVLTFALFLTVTLAAVGFVWLLSEYGVSEGLKAMFRLP
jgi:hypothetical protein